MFLKNYTSEVPVSQTIARIESVLIKCGVAGITKEYAPMSAGEVVAIVFYIVMDGGKFPIRLPVEWRKCRDALFMDYATGEKLTQDGEEIEWGGKTGKKKKRRKDFDEQAKRTAWKTIQDWIEVQMSMIQLQQADFREVFMPYIWDGKQTFYQVVRDRNFAGLLPEKSGGG